MGRPLVLLAEPDPTVAFMTGQFLRCGASAGRPVAVYEHLKEGMGNDGSVSAGMPPGAGEFFVVREEESQPCGKGPETPVR